MGIEVRVLGRPQVTVDGSVVPLRERQLLVAARLAMAHPAPVPRHRLLADLWRDDSARDGAVRVALTRLREALGGDVVRRVDGGYILSSPALVDAVRFARLVRHRDENPRQQLAAVDEALALWRGVPFDGVERVPWVEAESVRLEELREQAIDERFALLLDADEPSRVVPELRGELERDPTRERRAELLALALYRAGRQADALAAIDRTRTDLRERLGLDPGPSLRELEVRILRHDVSLRTPATAPPHPGALHTDGSLRTAATLTRVGAYEEAHTILDAAIAAARQARDHRALARALLHAARTSSLSGAADPHPLIDEARQIGRELGDGRLLAKCALVRFGSGIPTDKTQALLDLMEPLDLLPATAREQIDLLCAAAVYVLFIDASDAADRLLAAAERLHATAPTKRSEVAWLTARSIVGSLRGTDPRKVDRWAAQALEGARDTGEAELIVVSTQARLRALYSAGDLEAVDGLLEELDRASREASLAFGVVRVTLCEATNALARGELDVIPGLIAASRDAGRRLRTFGAEGMAAAQQVVLELELDRRDELAALARAMAAQSPANVWHGVLAMCGTLDVPLLTLAPDVPVDDLFAVFTALAAEAAARSGDAELGAWCMRHLSTHGESTIMSGLGTVVLGSARQFTGFARVALGDLDGAAADFEAAARMASARRAHLWYGHATVELADVLVRTGRTDRARRLLDGLRAGTSSPRLARRCGEVAATLAALDAFEVSRS